MNVFALYLYYFYFMVNDIRISCKETGCKTDNLYTCVHMYKANKLSFIVIVKLRVSLSLICMTRSNFCGRVCGGGTAFTLNEVLIHC